MKNLKLILGAMAIIIIFIAAFFLPILKQRPPTGTPNDYFEVLNYTTKLDVEFYQYSDTSMLPSSVGIINLDSVSDIPRGDSKNLKFVIIDMSSKSLSDNEVIYISEMYYDYCYYFIIIDYSKSNSSSLDNLISIDDQKEDFIVLDFTTCGDIHFSASIVSSIDLNNDQVQYTIMNLIKTKFDD